MTTPRPGTNLGPAMFCPAGDQSSDLPRIETKSVGARPAGDQSLRLAQVETHAVGARPDGRSDLLHAGPVGLLHELNLPVC